MFSEKTTVVPQIGGYFVQEAVTVTGGRSVFSVVKFLNSSDSLSIIFEVH